MDDDSPADDPPPPDDLPGFGPAVAILALLFASLLARWRRPDA